MADQHSDEGAGRANISVESSESTGIAHQGFDEGASTADVAFGSSETTGVANQHSDKGLSRDNVSVRSSESTGVADHHSDQSLSIADVALKSLKSTDQNSDEGASATTTNVTVRNSESTVELNIKTLDSQLHSFNVNKNMPVSVFKEKIASDSGLAVEQQRLIFRGKVLKDDDLLSEYHVENGDTMHLVSRQPSEFQPSSETTATSSNTGVDANVTGTHPRVDHVSHSIVLGTFGVRDQNEGGSPDINQVIGAVLNSFGIGGQTPIGGIETQPNTQSQPQSPSQSLPIPTLDTPIPDSLNTLSEFMNHMEQALSQNGYQASNSTEGLPAVQLPTNARGLPSTAALAVVLRHAHRLLSGPTVDSLSNTARRLEEEEGSTDVMVRTQIQTEVMQSGIAMQHLGALLLELGRTMLTLRIGQSLAESSVNAGPAVYISSSGPNPIMVQPFPLQTNSLFGGHVTPTLNPGAFGPGHLNIHIHAGPRATNVESNQVEFANGNAGDNSQSRGVNDNTRMKSLSETEGASSSSQRTTSSAIPLGLGSGGLHPKRRHRQTRSEAGSSGSSTSYSQSLTSAGGQTDPSTITNQLMQNPDLNGLLAGLSNQSGDGSPDLLRNMLSQLAQNPATMNMVNQLAQQMDGNQDVASMFAGSSGSGGNVDMSNMVQQMMPFVSQALNRGTSNKNLLQSVPSRKGGALHRRYSSVKSLNVKDRSNDFQMNLENAAQKIVEQYPPLEIFSSVVETAAALYHSAYDTGAFDELCSEEELALEFMEMLKRDVSRRLQGDRR